MFTAKKLLALAALFLFPVLTHAAICDLLLTNRDVASANEELNYSLLYRAFGKNQTIRHGLPKGVLARIKMLYTDRSGKAKVELAEFFSTGQVRVRTYDVAKLGNLHFVTKSEEATRLDPSSLKDLRAIKRPRIMQWGYMKQPRYRVKTDKQFEKAREDVYASILLSAENSRKPIRHGWPKGVVALVKSLYRLPSGQLFVELYEFHQSQLRDQPSSVQQIDRPVARLGNLRYVTPGELAERIYDEDLVARMKELRKR